MHIFIKCCEESNSADVQTKVKNVSKQYLFRSMLSTCLYFLYLTLRLSSSISYFSSYSKNSDLWVNAIDLAFWFPESDAYKEIEKPNTRRQGMALILLGFPGGLAVKNLPANARDSGYIPGSGRSLEKEMATHSSILAWEIPWTEEPGGL